MKRKLTDAEKLYYLRHPIREQNKHYHIVTNPEQRTITQWINDGFIPKKGIKGEILWTNGFCNHLTTWFKPNEVEPMPKEIYEDRKEDERRFSKMYARSRRNKINTYIYIDEKIYNHLTDDELKMLKTSDNVARDVKNKYFNAEVNGTIQPVQVDVETYNFGRGWYCGDYYITIQGEPRRQKFKKIRRPGNILKGQDE